MWRMAKETENKHNPASHETNKHKGKKTTLITKHRKS